MTVTIHMLNGDAISIGDVSEVRYEKANENSGKPDVLVLMKNTGPEADWSSYDVVGEFHVGLILGWGR